MGNYAAAIFDVDGTLLNTTEGVISSVKYTIRKHHLNRLPEDTLKSFIGPPIQDSFKKFYNLKEKEAQMLAETFREQYKNVDLLKAIPYEGIYEVLQQLKDMGIALAVATYKRQDYALKILEFFNFNKYTNILYGADPYNKMRKKDIIQKCLDDLGIWDHSQAVMIGDSDNDAIGAEKLGMNFIGVTYGFGFSTAKDMGNFRSIGCAKSPEEILTFFGGTEEIK